jgi:hypothetical protein
MKMGFAVVGLVLAIGCSGDDEGEDTGFVPADSQGGPCADRSGAYTVHYEELSGDCGPMNDEIVVAESSLGSACEGSSVTSTDNCVITTDVLCPAGGGETFRLSGQVAWSKDGSKATAKIDVGFRDDAGRLLCSSIYRVTFQR